jgi:hypothetical protein
MQPCLKKKPSGASKKSEEPAFITEQPPLEIEDDAPDQEDPVLTEEQEESDE